MKFRIWIIIALTVIFAGLAAAVPNGRLAAVENQIYGFIAGFISPAMTQIMIFITTVGSFTTVAAIIAILLAVPQTRRSVGMPVGISEAAAALLNQILKQIFARSRPDILRLIPISGYSFPSGHAMNNAALYAMLVLIVFKRTEKKAARMWAVIICSILVGLIGVSRVYLGVHYAGDVIAGWVLGITVALIVFSFPRKKKT